VIVDDVLEKEPPWAESLLTLFEGLDVIFVGVHCPLEELEKREQERGDRKQGMARLQFDQVHAQALYDIEVDTSKLSPQECATRIVDCMGGQQHPSAFERLRERTLSRGDRFQE
jgi:chloramphenicol 3-O phosphotransferase